MILRCGDFVRLCVLIVKNANMLELAVLTFRLAILLL